LGEVTVTGPSVLFEVRGGEVVKKIVGPEDFGFDRRPLESILGGETSYNKALAEAILSGENGAPREIVLINSALGIVAAGTATDFREGVARASESIDSGAAAAKLAALRAATN
jgi:anthranilate phosphoribosyltransferase